MSATERLLAAIVDIQRYVTHDIDPHKCAACPRWDELQGATMAAVAEIARLRASCDDYASHKQRQDERIIELQAEVERLRADAERYLWLIDNIDPADAGLPQPVDYWDTRDPVWKRQIDAAIDAAIRARGES